MHRMTLKVYLAGQDAGDPEALVAPVYRILHLIPRGTTVKDIDDLTYRMGGRAAMPTQPVLIRSADGVPTMIPGMGVTEAAELQDLAYAVAEKNEQRIKEGRPVFDREALGLVPREKFSDEFKNALEDRVKRHQANSVTDPARTPGWNGKRLW